MRRFACPPLLLLVVTCPLGGCRVSAPVHVWKPPVLASTVGKRVVLSTVAGPEELAEQVRSKLLAMTPTDFGRQTTLVDSNALQNNSGIQLVSATDDEPSDVALASVARREGVEFLLRGEVMEGSETATDSDDHDSLTISWCLTSLENGTSGGGIPVTIDTEQAVNRYPDLAFSNSRDDVLTTAAVRESYRLLTPSIRREQVRIEIPYLMPGSGQVRRGNLAALAGRWGEAEQIWSEVMERYPTQIPAIHNLALAAAAAQDFSRAKRLALPCDPTASHETAQGIAGLDRNTAARLSQGLRVARSARGMVRDRWRFARRIIAVRKHAPGPKDEGPSATRRPASHPQSSDPWCAGWEPQPHRHPLPRRQHIHSHYPPEPTSGGLESPVARQPSDRFADRACLAIHRRRSA